VALPEGAGCQRHGGDGVAPLALHPAKHQPATRSMVACAGSTGSRRGSTARQTYGLPPRPTVEAMHQAVSGWQAGTADWQREWDQAGEVCRVAFGRLLGAPAEEIALLPSVSVGVAIIAATLSAADDVVVPGDEFTSVLFPLFVAARERGAVIRTVPFERLADSVGDSTGLPSPNAGARSSAGGPSRGSATLLGRQ
jgi:hypothetical protein